MKKLLIKCLLFVLPLLVLSLPADIFLSNGLKKANYYAQDEFSIWNDLYEGKIDSKVVIYGASRAWVHFDPALIEKNTGLSAYNLGLDGHNFWLQYYRHKLLFDKNKKPEIIIFALDPFTLCKRTDLYNLDQFLPYMLFNNELRHYLDPFEGFSFFDFYIPLFRYYGKTKAIKYASKSSFIPFNPDTGRKNGYKGKLEVWNQDFDLAVEQKGKINVVTDSLTSDLFIRFLNECKEHKVKIVFVYSPEYIEGQKFVQNRSEIVDLYNQIAEKYGITFLDYSNDKICQDRNYFYNASHMRITGAELFTSKLIHDMKRLNLFVDDSVEKKIVSVRKNTE